MQTNGVFFSGMELQPLLATQTYISDYTQDTFAKMATKTRFFYRSALNFDTRFNMLRTIDV